MYLTNVLEQAHAGETWALRDWFTYQPAPETMSPSLSLSWVAAASRPLTKLERKRLKRAYNHWRTRAGLDNWMENRKREATRKAALTQQRKLNEFAVWFNRQDWDEAPREAVLAQIRDRQARLKRTIDENQPDIVDGETLAAIPDPFEAIGIEDNEVMPREGLFRYLQRL